ncbi:hypothetical protein [Acidovorax sp. SUPP3334]|uniref:ankyrin repeat domain-containing protein n=1 Tax=Acidovorax sp. SUPP3334 TaxID=2920881 RepID=UPI0023DE3C4D|nr:hypothetical protein [Acidovorax sp. SUPP3334]GKT25760.1 hypothetical protein AVHM3334_18980 [Acidovorax sp. SUPP3334]
MRYRLGIMLICLFSFGEVLAFNGQLSPAMQRLCDEVHSTKFTPSPVSLVTPHPEKLFNLIEIGGSDAEIIAALGRRSPDKIVVDGVTPMLMAALTGNWSAASVLIDKGADVNYVAPPAITTTPLEISIFNRKFIFACKLIEKGAKIPLEKSGRNSLFRDALITLPPEMEQGAIVVDFFLENGFDPNDMGSPLETPLMRVVGVESVPAIRVLLSHGARLDIAKKNGLTVWDVARKKNNPDVLKILNEAQEKADAAKKSGVKERLSR